MKYSSLTGSYFWMVNVTQVPPPLCCHGNLGDLIEPKSRIYVTNKNILLHVVFLSTRVY